MPIVHTAELPSRFERKAMRSLPSQTAEWLFDEVSVSVFVSPLERFITQSCVTPRFSDML